MVGKRIGSRSGEGNDPRACPSLGWTEVEMTTDVNGRLRDGHGAPQQVDSLGPQAEELASPESAVCGEEDRRPVAGVDRIGEGIDFDRGEEAQFVPLGDSDWVCRRLWDTQSESPILTQLNRRAPRFHTSRQVPAPLRRPPALQHACEVHHRALPPLRRVRRVPQG